MKQWGITLLGLFFLFTIIFAQAPFGNALILENPREYISIPIDTSLQVRGDVTVEVWVNIASVPKAQFAQIVQQIGLGFSDLERDNALYTIGLTNKGLLNAFHENDMGVNNSVFQGKVHTKTWIHIAEVRNTKHKTYQFFINGVALPQQTYANNPSGGAKSSTFIRGNSDSPFDGSIDELRIWNVARTQSQILSTMNDTLSPDCYLTVDSGLVGYWRFDKLEDLGVNTDGADDFRDFSVNKNHGDLVIRPEERISWLDDLDEAKAQALRENKLILADFWASWCGPCLAMDHNVWSREDIANLSDKFVCLKLDFDKEKKASWHYQVQAIPAMLFLDAFGNKIAHIIGYRSAQQMKEIMIALPNDLSDVYTLLQRIEKDKGNVDLIIDLGDRYRLWGLKRVSNTYYKKASKLIKIKKDPKKLDHIQTFTAVNYIFLDEPKRARKVLKKCLKKFPKSENRPLHFYCLVKVNMTLGKEKRAQEYYATLLKEFPDNKHTKWADELMNGLN